METSSIASAQASAEAIEFLEKSLTDNQHLEYHLGQQTIQLQEQIAENHQLSSESDSKIREHLETVSELKSTALLNTIRYNESEKKVSTIESDIETLSDKSEKMIMARDDLIKRLNKSNMRMQKSKRRQTKILRETDAELPENVRKLELKISENKKLRDSLHQDAARELRLQEQLRSTIEENGRLQHSLGFLQVKDLKQQYTISSIQRQLQQFKSGEKYKGLQQTARYKTVEIEELKEQVRRQDKELQKKDAQITRYIASVEKDKAVARLKGEILAHNIPSLDNVLVEKMYQNSGHCLGNPS